jgi:hypothetical protein
MSSLAVAQFCQVVVNAGVPSLLAMGFSKGFNAELIPEVIPDSSNQYNSIRNALVLSAATAIALNAFVGMSGIGWGLVGGSIFLLGASVIHLRSKYKTYNQLAPTMIKTALATLALTILADRALKGQLLPLAATIGSAKITQALAPVFALLLILNGYKEQRMFALAATTAACAVSIFAPFPTTAVFGMLLSGMGGYLVLAQI